MEMEENNLIVKRLEKEVSKYSKLYNFEEKVLPTNKILLNDTNEVNNNKSIKYYLMRYKKILLIICMCMIISYYVVNKKIIYFYKQVINRSKNGILVPTVKLNMFRILFLNILIFIIMYIIIGKYVPNF